MDARELTHLVYTHVKDQDQDRALLISGDDHGDGTPTPTGEFPHIAVTDRGTIFADPFGDEGRLVVRPPGANSRAINVPFVPATDTSVALALDAALAYLDAVADTKQ